MPNEKFINIVLRRFVILKSFLTSGLKLVTFRSYWKNKTIMSIFFSSCLVNIFLWIFLFKNQRNSELPIILHYNLFFGVDYLGSYNEIYLLPAVGATIIILNTILGCLLYERGKLASYFLVFNIFIVQLFLLLAGYLIVEINL
ncbi:MAG: hypothetical protein U9N04_04395 [Patescibacteria group bacterium]|nr:hypothetical protein [Patescibacteria group bacterium]